MRNLNVKLKLKFRFISSCELFLFQKVPLIIFEINPYRRRYVIEISRVYRIY